MKNDIQNIVDEYLKLYPNEKERQFKLISFLNNNNELEITDWNNFNGHIVASGIVYSKNDNNFLVMSHKDLKILTYPGGHVDKKDKTPLEAAKRETKEETGLDDFIVKSLTKNELIPIDIDTHLITYNERLNLPEHHHFDFRYLFIVEKNHTIKLDLNELSEYKWITKEEFYRLFNIEEKIDKLL